MNSPLAMAVVVVAAVVKSMAIFSLCLNLWTKESNNNFWECVFLYGVDITDLWALIKMK